MTKMTLGKEGAGSGSSWLDVPGRFHAMILNVDGAPKKQSDNTPIDAIKVTFSVCAPAEQQGRQHDLYLYHPDPTKSEKAYGWAQRKQTAFVIAAGLATEAQLGAEVDVNLQSAAGRHFFIELASEEDQQGKPRLQLAYANIFHVDDPEVADATLWPRNAAAIAKLPAAARRDPSNFAKRERRAAGGTGGSGNASGATAGAAAGGAASKNANFEGF